MKTVNDVVQSLADSLSEMQEQFDTLSRIQSACDRQVASIYHEIETATFNACDGYKYAKKLQEALKQRRTVKNQVHAMKRLVDTVHPRELLHTVQSFGGDTQ